MSVSISWDVHGDDISIQVLFNSILLGSVPESCGSWDLYNLIMALICFYNEENRANSPCLE